MSKVALITGITGQDGSYLAELLLEHGYEVWGFIRRSSLHNDQLSRLENLIDQLNLVYGDMTDSASISKALKKSNPMEIYNLAAQSDVRISFDIPIHTVNTVAVGVLNLLESVREFNSEIKIYQASSSEMFGNSVDDDGFQREITPMNPVSPYGCAKLFGYNITRNYRNSYGMFISNGILFNHESSRRGHNFVTNKVVHGAINIKRGIQEKLVMGNLESKRDWGHSKDYVLAMWMILQYHKSDDFVCSTGISHSVRELVEYVFEKFDMDYRKYVVQDEQFFRPEELKELKGDCSKIMRELDWKPNYTFHTMLDEMIEGCL